METTNTNIKKEVLKQAIIVSRVYKSDYQKKGTLTAELKQTIITKTTYPAISIVNNLNDNIFGPSEFKEAGEPKSFETTETRVAWIDVPTDATVASVQERLNNIKGTCLYKILSNRPILSDNDSYAIDSAEIDITEDDYANRQAVRYGENSDKAGELILDANGKVQYRRIAFSRTAKEDVDLRTEDPADFYASPELAAELNGEVMPSQSLLS